MANRFILLEITDQEIASLLLALRAIFSFGEKRASGIHLTVRGPYVRPIDKRAMKSWTKAIQNDTLKIHGVGLFPNASSYVVYLDVRTEHLRKIWYKPDYPIKDYGFNPHITLYEGKNLAFAKRIFGFLADENLQLETKQFQLIDYVSGQRQLSANPSRVDSRLFPNLIASGQIRKGLLSRARRIAGSCKSSSEEAARASNLFDV